MGILNGYIKVGGGIYEGGCLLDTRALPKGNTHGSISTFPSIYLLVLYMWCQFLSHTHKYWFKLFKDVLIWRLMKLSFLEMISIIFLSFFCFDRRPKNFVKVNQEPSKMRPFSGEVEPLGYTYAIWRLNKEPWTLVEATHPKHQLRILPTPPTKDNPQTTKYTIREPDNWSGYCFWHQVIFLLSLIQNKFW